MKYQTLILLATLLGIGAIPTAGQSPSPAGDDLSTLSPPPSVPAAPLYIPLSPAAPLPSVVRPVATSDTLRTISSGPTMNRRIALTFDDGPHQSITLKVLEALRSRSVKATFFVLGERVKLYPSVLQQIALEGHEIGNHTFSHHSLKELSAEASNQEVSLTQDIIKQTVGFEPRLFRPPYGALRADTQAIFRQHNLQIVLWSVDPEDWKFRDATFIHDHVVKNVQPGSIILLHDIHPAIIAALPRILDTLIAQGYVFTTVSDLCGVACDVAQGDSN